MSDFVIRCIGIALGMAVLLALNVYDVNPLSEWRWFW